jgi:hypothetical protein
MLGLFRKKRVTEEEGNYAITQGQIIGLYTVLGILIDNLPVKQRDGVVAALKSAVDAGLGGDGEFLRPELRQVYNDAMTSIMHGIIDGRSSPELMPDERS